MKPPCVVCSFFFAGRVRWLRDKGSARRKDVRDRVSAATLALLTMLATKRRDLRNGRENWTRNTRSYSGIAANGIDGSSYLSYHCIARYVENMKTKQSDLEITFSAWIKWFF